ncbi:MAG: hypothetical protein LBU65_04190 [Planctomycetaceae bacterium]|jgi:hypothetical protein|nr:hypothetical protein [Planctomycetaceae bacterium]
MALVSAIQQSALSSTDMNRNGFGRRSGSFAVSANNIHTLEAIYQDTLLKHRDGNLANTDIKKHFSELFVCCIARSCRSLKLDVLVAEEDARIVVRAGMDSIYCEKIDHQILKRSKIVFASMNTVRDYKTFFERVCPTGSHMIP